MNRHEDDLERLTNRSGFLFQLAVEDDVRRSTKIHRWEVVAREYPWSTAGGSRSGFIDFMATRGGLRCIFECKRTQDGDWIFLVPDDRAETKQVRTLWSHVARNGSRRWGWDDLHFEPPSLRSDFCVVRGASDDDRPMLERIAADLVRASESLAREELQMPGRGKGPMAYLPVIVTNANLVACRVDPSSVDLATGAVPPMSAFDSVNVIRFRKALPSDLTHGAETYSTFSEGSLLKERGVFVVHVDHLNIFLDRIIEVRGMEQLGSLPWEGE